MVPDSPEHCLREAEECDRLAGLSRTAATRQILQSVSFQWRQLAKRASQRADERLDKRLAGRLSLHARPATAGTRSAAPMGARVLVVEDEAGLADTLCDLLQTAGCEPVGPAANVAMALCLIEEARIDAAILDMRLMGEMSFAVAYALRARSIPLMFLTAYQRRDLPVDLSDEILIEKPFKAPVLIETVRRMARADAV